MKRLGYIILLFLTVFLCACDKTDTGIENYLNTGRQHVTEQAELVMPSLEAIGNYQDIEYWYGFQDVLFFESHAFLLRVYYTPEEYVKKVEELQQEYLFLEEPVQYSEQRSLLPQAEFELDDYTFRVVKEKAGWKAVYPKDFMMIGWSEEQESILYLYFYDPDLDYISSEEDPKSMEDFIREYYEL